MIDLSTMRSLELIQNLQNAKSRDCLYGLLNQTLTPMGARLLKSNVLQPSINREVLEKRWDALYELTAKEDVFFAVRQGSRYSILFLSYSPWPCAYRLVEDFLLVLVPLGRQSLTILC